MKYISHFHWNVHCTRTSSLYIVQRLSRAGPRGRASEWATLGVHPLSWLLSNNRLEEVCGTRTKGTFSSRLLLSNQDKECTPSVAHSLPLPLPPGFCSTCQVYVFHVCKWISCYSLNAAVQQASHLFCIQCVVLECRQMVYYLLAMWFRYTQLGQWIMITQSGNEFLCKSFYFLSSLYNFITAIINPRLQETFCNTSTEGSGYNPFPRFLI